MKEEGKASEHRQTLRKREAEEVDKVEVAPEATVASLRRFRAALVGPAQGLPSGVGCADRELRVQCCRCYAFGYKCKIVAIRGGVSYMRMACNWQYTKLYRVPFFVLLLPCYARVLWLRHTSVFILYGVLFYGLHARPCILPIFAGRCSCIFIVIFVPFIFCRFCLIPLFSFMFFFSFTGIPLFFPVQFQIGDHVLYY